MFDFLEVLSAEIGIYELVLTPKGATGLVATPDGARTFRIEGDDEHLYSRMYQMVRDIWSDVEVDWM